MYDVMIAGGSFAGLAVAMQLRGRRVLLLDQRPIGSHQTSTCAIPLVFAERFGVTASIQEVHDAVILHTGGQEIRLPLHYPYVTFDYYAFCQAMLRQTDAEVRQARVLGYADGVVTTDQGPVSGSFVVDASGWRSVLRPQAREAGRYAVAYGIETELPGHLTDGPGLHFYSEKRIVRNGYGWVFPCGESTRIGVCSFDRGVSPTVQLSGFLERFGLRKGQTHGGVMATSRREPVSSDVFAVGDSAGMCLPFTAEGIRAALFFGERCGLLIEEALADGISADEARRRYRAEVRRKNRHHDGLIAMQTLLASSPERLRAAAGRLVARPALRPRIINAYLKPSGWI